LIVAVMLGLAGAALGQELNARIEAAAANYKLGGARVGVSVVDLDSGRTLADLHAAEGFTPASNMKLLTTGASLIVLGKDFVFKTELIMNGTRLVIRGSGDPALGDPFVLEKTSGKPTVDGLLEQLANSVKAAGVTSVSEVIVDDRVFDRQYTHPSWPKDQLDRWYCAEVSGLNFHTNVLSVFPSPGAETARPPVYTLEPSAPWLEIENKGRTVAGTKNSVWLSRDPSANRYTIFGEVAVPTHVPVEITMHEVPTFVGQLVSAALPRAGVTVGSVAPTDRRLDSEQLAALTKVVRLARADEDLSGRTVAVVTTPMEDILDRCNGDSQNLYAESMIKRIGHEVTHEPGSWTNGSSVLRMTIAEPWPKGLGPEYAASTQVTDGSGMSREDRVAPRTLTKWLDRLQRDSAIGEMFVNSLASPEHKESIRRRFRDKKLACDLRAKTGTINGVRCLSGYLTDLKTGHRLAFSVMVNDLKEGEQALQARDFHEDVVVIADKWLASQRAQAGAER
jgi:D-alanyl-D-alanine carboxypeptidase/D-alanyl-D-alanine-endopeptidase (penicillin-binding protein 4)